MSNNDKKIWLTNNGEIYNFLEINKEIQNNNYPWKTDHSDTDILLYANKQWGIEFIHKLRG